MKGVVVYYDSDNHYGFIEYRDGEIFFHESNVIDEVEEHDVVTFDIGEGVKGPEAFDVKLFDDSVDDSVTDTLISNDDDDDDDEDYLHQYWMDDED